MALDPARQPLRHALAVAEVAEAPLLLGVGQEGELDQAGGDVACQQPGIEDRHPAGAHTAVGEPDRLHHAAQQAARQPPA